MADPFSTLSNYEVAHLVTHLLNAGDARSVARILRMDSGSGTANGWFAEKERRADMGGYLADVEASRTRSAAESAAAVRQGDLAVTLGEELRCALLQASVGSLSRGLPPTLVAALVRCGHWPDQQGIAYARQQPFAPLRAEAFALLVRECPVEVRRHCIEDALAAARSIQWRPDWRVRALAQIARVAPRPWKDDILDEGLQVILEVGQLEIDENSAELLAAVPDDLWPAWQDSLAELSMTTEKPVRPGVDRMGGRPLPWTHGVLRFAALVPRMSGTVRTGLAAAARAAPEPVHRALLLAALADGERALGEAREAADTIFEPDLRAQFDAALAHRLDPQAGRELLQRHLSEAAYTGVPAMDAGVLVAIAPCAALSGDRDVVRRALEACRGVDDVQRRSYLLRFLAPTVPDDLMPELLADTEALDDGEDWGRVTAALAPRLGQAELAELLQRGRRVGDDQQANYGLCRLAAHAGPGVRAAVAARLLDEVLADGSGERWPWEPALWLRLLDPQQIARVVERSTVITEPGRRRNALGELAAVATEDAWREAAVRSADPSWRVAALEARADGAEQHNRTALLAEAAVIATEIEDLRTRLDLTIPLLHGGAADETTALGLAVSIHEADLSAAEEADALASLVPHLPEQSQSAAVDDVLAQATAALDEQQPWLDELVPRLREFQYGRDEYSPARALKDVLPYIVDAQWESALAVVGRIRDENDRSTALVAAARAVPARVRLDSGYFVAAGALRAVEAWASAHLDIIDLIHDDQLRRMVIRYLLEYLPLIPTSRWHRFWPTSILTRILDGLDGEHLRLAQDAVDQIGHVEERETALATLVPRLPPFEAITITRQLKLPDPRRQALRTLLQQDLPDAERAELEQMLADLPSAPPTPPALDSLGPEERATLLEGQLRSWLAEINPGRAEEPVLDYIKTAPPERLHALWSDVAAQFTGASRIDVIDQIGAAAHLWSRMGGSTAVDAIAEAVLDVRRWWP